MRSLLPAPALPAFVVPYGGIDPELQARTLGWVVLFALTLLGIALEGGRPTYGPVGLSTLAKLLG